MRYFTRGIANGEGGDRAEMEAIAAYKERLATILPGLSPSMRSLADLDLVDAIVSQVVWHTRSRKLCLVLVAGDLQSGYCTVFLTYVGANLGQNFEALKHVAQDREAELLAHEIDVEDDDGSLAHRLLFRPREELTVWFSELELRREPRSDRLVDLGGSFVEYDEEDDAT